MIPEEKFWKEKGNNHLGKLKGNEFGERFDVLNILKGMLWQYNTVLEIGCGEGRLCDAFRPNQYLGLDVNTTSIKIAKEKHPGYAFRLCEYHDNYPAVSAVLLYTVLMHVSDDEIQQVISNVVAAAPVIVVSEMMGREWGMSRFKKQSLPAYNRNLFEYKEMFVEHDYDLVEYHDELVERYKSWKGKRNIHTSFIKFEKANA